MTSLSEDGRGSAGHSAGFTLIELLVVLTILGLILGLVVAYRPGSAATLTLNGAAGELAAGMRLARSQAIAGDRPVAVAFNLAGHSYRIGDGPPRFLPATLAIELLTITGQRRDAIHGEILFNSDGSSTGGRVSLGDGHRRIAVGVDWLTGRVGVADVR